MNSLPTLHTRKRSSWRLIGSAGATGRPPATLMIALLTCSLVGACASPPAGPGDSPKSVSLDEFSIVDLTHTFNSETIFWPTDEDGFVMTEVFKGTTDGGFHYEASTFRTAEHGGTHLDAPIHFAEGAHSTEQIPLERLVGSAVVIDVSTQSAQDRDHLISVADVEAWEASHGRIPADAILLFNTGFGSYWPDREKYLGTSATGPDAVPLLHFPGIAPELATWLTTERTISAVGLDTPSIDRGQSSDFKSHQILFAANIPGFENLANVDELPPTGAQVVALPMKIEGGSGGPLRIIALLAK